MSSPLFISAIGDISFEGHSDKPSAEIFSAIAPVLKSSDFIVANLENPLTQMGDPVKGKCTLKGNPGWARIMKEVGIDLVNLANNHMMDYGQEGLISTIRSLKLAGLEYVGAGINKHDACHPTFLNIRGKRIAVFGRSCVIVSSPSSAGHDHPGVAFLDIDDTKKNINVSKQRADIIILLIHWGVEEYHYPSSYQRLLAEEFIEAGADLILGHHPHVIQGLEKIDNGLVCYSLGNFVFDDIQWSFIDEEGQQQDRVVKLTKDNRKGGILEVTLSGKGVQSYDFLPTFILSNGTVIVDNTLQRKREFNRLTSRLQWPAYSLLWRLYSMRQEWKLRLKPFIRGKLTWEKLKKLRPKHFRELMDRVRRSAKITTEKSTNPYE